MRSTTLRLGIAITLGLVCCVPLRSDDQVDDPARASVGQSEQDWEQRVSDALNQKVTVRHADVELRDFVTNLRELTGQLWLLDLRALEDVGIGDDVPLTFQFKEMSVRSVVNHALGDLDLTWVVQDRALEITTPEVAERHLHTRIIDIADLIRPFPGAPDELRDYDSVIDLLTTIVAPDTWDSVGGPGTIQAFRGGLVVSQTREVLEEIETLLTQFRAARKLAEQHIASPPPKVAVGPLEDNPATARIANALEQTIRAEFSETPLSEVAERLSKLCDINILLDSRAMDDVGMSADVPVSFQSDRISVHHVLRHMLRSLDLTTTIRDEALIITTPEEAECRLISAAYPVADLLGPAGERDLFGDSRRLEELDGLINLITTSCTVDSWEIVGGPCSIAACRHIDVLVISQTTDGHTLVADLFAKARRHLAAQPVASDEQAVANEPAKTRLVVYGVPSAASPLDRPSKSRSKPASEQSRHAIQGEDVLSQMGMGGGMGGFGGGGGNAVATVEEPRPAIPESQLLGTIIELVEPGSWSDRNDVYAKVLPGRLLIRHTDAVHRKIEVLLTKLGVPFQTVLRPQAHHSGVMAGGMF